MASTFRLLVLLASAVRGLLAIREQVGGSQLAALELKIGAVQRADERLAAEVAGLRRQNAALRQELDEVRGRTTLDRARAEPGHLDALAASAGVQLAAWEAARGREAFASLADLVRELAAGGDAFELLSEAGAGSAAMLGALSAGGAGGSDVAELGLEVLVPALAVANPMLGAVAVVVLSFFAKYLEELEDLEELQELEEKIMRNVAKSIGQKAREVMQATVQDRLQSLLSELEWMPEMLAQPRADANADLEQHTRLVWFIMLQHDLATLMPSVFNHACLTDVDSEECVEWAKLGTVVQAGLFASLHLNVLAEVARIEPGYKPAILRRIHQAARKYLPLLKASYRHFYDFRMSAATIPPLSYRESCACSTGMATTTVGSCDCFMERGSGKDFFTGGSSLPDVEVREHFGGTAKNYTAKCGCFTGYHEGPTLAELQASLDRYREEVRGQLRRIESMLLPIEELARAAERELPELPPLEPTARAYFGCRCVVRFAGDGGEVRTSVVACVHGAAEEDFDFSATVQDAECRAIGRERYQLRLHSVPVGLATCADSRRGGLALPFAGWASKPEVRVAEELSCEPVLRAAQGSPLAA